MRLAEEDGLALGAEQRQAVRHVTERGDLALVVGYAGTGKSAMLGVAREAGRPFAAPPLQLCTDNAAMIAWAAIERARAGLLPGPVTARPRWPLDEEAAPLVGGGKKGAKA